MKTRYLIIICVLIFVVSVSVHYWPIFHKGYTYNISGEYLVLAKNLSLTGEYKTENEKGVILSSQLIKEEGVSSNMGNKLEPILYSKLFDIFGFNTSIPLYFSLIAYALMSVLFFVLILKLFNLWTALIFVMVDIFSPMVLANSIWSGAYKWAMLFFVLGLFFYLYKRKPSCWRLFISGAFFGLASFAGNVFAVSFLPFLIYEFYKNKSFKRVLVFASVILLFWACYLSYGFIQGGGVDNSYFRHSDVPSSEYLHLFPDSYTYHFDRENYINEISDTSDPDLINGLRVYKYGVSFYQRIGLYLSSALFYVKEFFRNTTVGGALMLVFFFLGLGFLYKKRKDLFILFSVWFLIWYFFLIFFGTSSGHHFVEIRFPIFLSIAFGVYWLVGLILSLSKKDRFRHILVLGLLLFILLDLIQSGKWLFHEKYENSNIEQILEVVEILNKSEAGKEEIVAVGIANNAPLIINYYTDLNLIYFDPNTIEKLLEEDKLQWAFGQFEVDGVVGYEPDLIEKIVEQTKVKSF